MARRFGFRGWDLPIVLAMLVAAAATVSLLALGVAMIADGEAQVSAADARVYQQNSHGCGNGFNGTGPYPSCDPQVPCDQLGNDCPGQQLANLGGMVSLESLIPLGSMGALGLLQFIRWAKVPP
ncbi:MAG TPA: hypothetical protein VN864_06025 [Thermoplasmata archaeon]|nr:hypothetical protein [Thermoplasmata archaeon]